MSIIDTVGSTAALCRTILQSPDRPLPRETIVLICKAFIDLAEQSNKDAQSIIAAQSGVINTRMQALRPSAATDLARKTR